MRYHQLLGQTFAVPQWLVLHVLIDVIARDELGPVLALLDEELRLYSNLVEVKYTLCYAKATVA